MCVVCVIVCFVTVCVFTCEVVVCLFSVCVVCNHVHTHCVHIGCVQYMTSVLIREVWSHIT